MDELGIAGSSRAHPAVAASPASLRRGDRVFLTCEPTDRGTESSITSLMLLDMTVHGRQDIRDSSEGRPQGPTYSFWRKDGRPTTQWTQPSVTPSVTS
jgi:predicted dithiol-disulfide oxidoreductase (DUF899 family)